MSIFGQLFGSPDPEDVFRMPDNPVGFTSELSRRKFWRNIDQRVLQEIGRNAEGKMELLRNFVFVSEQCQLVSNKFVSFARTPSFGSPLLEFALSLRNTGSELCKQIISATDTQQRKFYLLLADMAFTSAILCDPFRIEANADMALLYSQLHLNKKVVLEYCQKYKLAERRLLNTPDEQLSPLHRSMKNLIQDPQEVTKSLNLMEKYSPQLRASLPDYKPMMQVIEELERNLLLS